MSNHPAPSTAPAPAMSGKAAVVAIVNRYKSVIGKLLVRSGISEETFVAQLGNAFRASPTLWNCDPETVLGAALRSAQLALPPNDGQNLAWIIPYGRTATFQLGYGGVLELARRANPGVIFDGAAVYPGDEFDLDLGRDQPLIYRPAYARLDKAGRRGSRKSRDAFAWFVRARFPDGRTHVHALDRDGVEYHRAFSKQPNGDAWTKSYDAMALKSVVLDMRRWLPSSAALALAVSSDGDVIDVRDLDEDAPRREITSGDDPDQLTLDEEPISS